MRPHLFLYWNNGTGSNVMKNMVRKQFLLMVLLLLFFCGQSLLAIVRTSATFDEVQSFGIGKYLLTEQKWDVMGSITHPPVGYYLTSLPLLFWNEDKSFWEYEGADRNDIFFLGAVDVYRGQGFLSSEANAEDRLLILSRLPVLVLALFLGFYLYRFSRELYGERAALLSLALFAFCPNLLAFSAIGTQDMPLAVFWFISCFYFWRFLNTGEIRAVVISAILIGLAIATKFTAFLLIPQLLFCYCLYQYMNKKRFSPAILIIGILPFIVLFACYGFNLRPFIRGYELLQIGMNVGQAAFFKGELSNRGWWNYYLAAFLWKTPLVTLLLFAAAVIAQLKKSAAGSFQLVFLLTPVLMLLIVSSSSNFAVGTRYLLPIYPFIHVFAGQLAESRGRLMTVIFVLVSWLAVSTSLVAPHYLAYFNESVGGPANGYKYLLDSNLDWGQGLKELKKYMDKEGIKKVSLSYFGTDSPARYGIQYDWLPSHHLYNPKPDETYRVDANRYLAISATNLQGVYLQNPDEFKWLRDKKPVAKIGYGIFIYDLAQAGNDGH
jgi:4-amino-4-deoxy-L-arabinose transferase-like glycosyltransferase